MRNYKIGLSIWGVILFLIIMLPNLIWSAVPAPDDVLRHVSQTGTVDVIASVCQVLFVAALCALVHRDAGPLRPTPPIAGAICCVGLYYVGWVLYYAGFTGPLTVFLLTAPPCGAFLLFALDRKNDIALVPAVVFTLCHLYHGYAVLGAIVRVGG